MKNTFDFSIVCLHRFWIFFPFAKFCASLSLHSRLTPSTLQIFRLLPLLFVSRLIVLSDVCEEQRGDP